MKPNMLVVAALALVSTGVAAPEAWAQTAKADFRDSAADKVRSDFGTSFDPAGTLSNYQPCGVDYVDTTDTCTPATDGDRNTYSKELTRGTYFLRTISSHTNNPTRWLMLDFSTPVAGSSCLGLDTRIKSYQGRSPSAQSPENPDPCVDYVEARFYVGRAFDTRVQSGEVEVIIDGPDAAKTATGTMWNEVYSGVRDPGAHYAESGRNPDGEH